jgi:hypothetical protein
MKQIDIYQRIFAATSRCSAASSRRSLVGCDIVPYLVVSNAARYATERIKFRNLDMVTDALPAGDLLHHQAGFPTPLERRYRHHEQR